MYIAILQDGEVENELDIDLCCLSCSKAKYKWSATQFQFVKDHVRNEKPVPVSGEVDGLTAFIEYIRVMKL